MAFSLRFSASFRSAASAPLLLLSALAFSGCTRPLTLKPPVATVRSVRLAKQTQEAARLEAVVELSNPNKEPLPMRKSRYTLVVDGVGRATLDDLPNRTIPGMGTQTLTLPAAIARRTRRDLAGGHYRMSGSLTYDPPGNLRRFLSDSGLPLPTVGFSRSGTLE